MSESKTPETASQTDKPAPEVPAAKPAAGQPVEEVGGPEGPEPTRFGDWEKAGRCSDF